MPVDAIVEAKVAETPAATDQRNRQRFDLDCPATLSLVGTSNPVLRCEIRNISEGGTQIRLSGPLQPFALVKVEYEDNLLLGEVVYCEQDESGWLAGLRVEHGLFGLAALARVMNGF